MHTKGQLMKSGNSTPTDKRIYDFMTLGRTQFHTSKISAYTCFPPQASTQNLIGSFRKEAKF